MDPKISAIAGLVLAQTEWKWDRCLQFAYDVQTINDGLDAASSDPARRALARRNQSEEDISKDARFVAEHAGRNKPSDNSGSAGGESDIPAENDLQPVGDETE